MIIDPERLAFWYLRLNGFLTITNFLVHPETRRDYSTEVDVLGVRFPFRAENMTRPMKDYDLFTKERKRVYLVIAEVKNSACGLNGPWAKREARNMEKVLAAIGVFPRDDESRVAESLYTQGRFVDDRHILTLLCIGRSPSSDLEERYPLVPQLTFDAILRFIHGRLVDYLNEKAQHEQWDRYGKALWNTVDSFRDLSDFLQAVEVRQGASPLDA